MKHKGLQRKLSSLLCLIMLTGSLFTPADQFVYAADAEETDAAGSASEDVSAPEEQPERQQPEEEQRVSLKDLAEEYTVPDKAQGEEFKIIYVLENGAVLREDYEKKLESFGNERASVSVDGQLIQTFEKGSEDTLAPLVYHKDGYITERSRRWKLTYTYTDWVPVYDACSITIIRYDPVTRTATQTFPVGTAVKTLEGYAENGVIRLYPNWEAVNELQLDFHSNLENDEVKSITVKQSDEYFRVPGNRDERLGFKNDGFMVVSWNTAADGSGEDTLQRHTEVYMDDLFDIAKVNGGKRTVTLYGQWDTLRYGISFDRNVAQLEDRARQALEEGVSVNEEQYEKQYYSWDQSVSVNAYTANQSDYEMKGWAFTPDATEAAISANALSGLTAEEVFLLKEESPAADDEEDMSLYAFWGYHDYVINYRGIRVLSANTAPGNAAADNEFSAYGLSLLSERELESLAATRGVFINDAVAYEILGEEEIDGFYALPESYNIGETTILPGADVIDQGLTDPEFTEKYDFICWTKNKWMRRDVASLGKNGDIHDGDVTLYAVYSPKQMTASVNEGQHAAVKEFKAVQVNTPNLLNRSDYAVIRLEGETVHADMLSVSFNNGSRETDYYELCAVDSTKAKLGQGYATIGIRLKDGVSADQIKAVSKASKLELKVRGINDPEGTEQTISLVLKTNYKLPKFSADVKSLTIYKELLEKDGRAEFFLRDKKGSLVTDLLDGKWELDFVDSAKKTVIEDVKLSLDGENVIKLTASKATKGYIRIRNTNWIDGAYSYVPLTIKEGGKKAGLALSATKVTLNNAYDTEEAYVTVKLAGGMRLTVSGLSVTPDKKWPEKGLSVSCNDDVICISGAKDVKKGSYKLIVSAEGTKSKTLTVKVADVKADKALKYSVKGKADAVYGGQLFLTPKITGFSGEICSARVVKESVSLDKLDPSLMRYEAYWNGKNVVLSATDDFRPLAKKMDVSVELSLSTGRTLTADVTIKPTLGKFNLKVLDAVVSGNTVSTPVMASYTWNFYYVPNGHEKRVSDFDLTDPLINELIKIGDKNGKVDGISKAGVISGSYKDGLVTLSLDPGFKADKQQKLKLSLPAVWSVDGKSYKAGFNVTILPKAE